MHCLIYCLLSRFLCYSLFIVTNLYWTFLPPITKIRCNLCLRGLDFLFKMCALNDIHGMIIVWFHTYRMCDVLGAWRDNVFFCAQYDTCLYLRRISYFSLNLLRLLCSRKYICQSRFSEITTATSKQLHKICDNRFYCIFMLLGAQAAPRVLWQIFNRRFTKKDHNISH